MLNELLRASRPFSWINTTLPFLAVGLWVHHRITPALVIGAVFFLFPYNLLLYGANDLYDFESDRRNPRKGGLIEGGVVPPRHGRRLWFAIGLSTIPLLGAIAFINPPGAIALLLTSIVALAYSVPPLRFKEIPGIDALTAASAFVLPASCGAVIAGATAGGFPWLYLWAFLAWGLASQALGAIQDIRYDRTAHIHSISTALGPRATAVLATSGYLASVVLVASPEGPSRIAAAALVPYFLLAAACVLGNPARWARRAWRGFLALNLVSGFVITMVLIQTGAVALLAEAP